MDKYMDKYKIESYATISRVDEIERHLNSAQTRIMGLESTVNSLEKTMGYYTFVLILLALLSFSSIFFNMSEKANSTDNNKPQKQVEVAQ